MEDYDQTQKPDLEMELTDVLFFRLILFLLASRTGFISEPIPNWCLWLWKQPSSSFSCSALSAVPCLNREMKYANASPTMSRYQIRVWTVPPQPACICLVNGSSFIRDWLLFASTNGFLKETNHWILNGNMSDCGTTDGRFSIETLYWFQSSAHFLYKLAY